ncbi:MAG TPA: carboxylesterase family protein [Candidatus Binatia bacterium]|nr:carboxylesterase family protein [Candidatus Binatia bacterium]
MDYATRRRIGRTALCLGTTLALAMQAAPAGAGATPAIDVTGGQVVGHSNDGVQEFLGIPFAAPPVGPLRFRPPAPVEPFGLLDAADYSGSCPQVEAIIGTPSENEDCLYLNVWSPDLSPEEPRPVMVWIHGGGNVSGSTGDLIPFPPYEGQRFYDASNLAGQRNVVVVSLNYRLGVFGFFGHADLADESLDHPYAGNQGLLDQVAALVWVRDNIASFGGDPANVTIFGESAGSWDVCAHMVSPLSSGLFHRAISQSGGCSVGVQTAEDADVSANAIAAALGCDGVADELACLRAVPVADLLAAGPAGEASPGIGANLGISIDGRMVPDHPRDMFDAGDFERVPYILGANSDEGTLFFAGSEPIETEEEYQAELLTRFGDFAEEVALLYPSDDFDSVQDALVRVVGDASLVCSTFDVAKRVAAHKNRTYVYNFARVPPLPFVSLLDLGAFHGAEIAYVFGSVEAPTPTDNSIGVRMREYWSRFAENGKPKATKALGWPKFNAKSQKVLRINAEFNKLAGFRRAQCEFWSTVYETL